MKILRLMLRRIANNGNATLGHLSFRFPWNDAPYHFSICEDEPREVKVNGETRIPPGTYEIKLREDSPMARRYRDRFGDDHKGIPWLQDVPGFTWVYLHVGNREDETDGCLLTGEGMDFASFTVSNSVAAYNVVQAEIQKALERGYTVVIHILDFDNMGGAV